MKFSPGNLSFRSFLAVSGSNLSVYCGFFLALKIFSDHFYS